MSSLFGPYSRNLVPGMGPEIETTENEIWWGRADQRVIIGGVLDKDTVDAGNDPTTLLRVGLALGRITASDQLTHWNPYATDGSHALVGFLTGTSQAMLTYGGTTAERLSGDIMVGGNVYGDRLLIPGESALGISGKNYELLLLEQMQGRFQFSGDYNTFAGTSRAWKYRECATATTLTKKDTKTHITNLGAAGSVTLTLPAPLPGFEILVTVVTAQNIVLASTSTGQFLNGTSTVDNDTLTAANRETIRVFVVRSATSPTWLYKMSPVPA